MKLITSQTQLHKWLKGFARLAGEFDSPKSYPCFADMKVSDWDSKTVEPFYLHHDDLTKMLKELEATR